MAGLVAARDGAKTDAERNRLTLQLVLAYGAQKHWKEEADTSVALAQAAPTSIRAFELAASALGKIRAL